MRAEARILAPRPPDSAGGWAGPGRGGASRPPAPLVQVSIGRWGNDAAIAYQHRRCLDNCAFQQIAQGAKFAHFFTQDLHRMAVDTCKLLAQVRQLLKGVTHPG